MSKRQYISTAHFNAPFEGAHYLSGLGSALFNTKQGVFGPGGHGGGIFQTTVDGLGNDAMSTGGRAGEGMSAFGPVAIPPAPGVAGLGAASFPKGRSYWSTAHFRAPYDHFGYFQDNNLMGLGNSASVVLRQIPTWAYAVGGIALLYGAHKAYKKVKGKK